MSWICKKGDPGLPPIQSWVFYMVNPYIEREGFNGCAFYEGLEPGRLGLDEIQFRYEFFFIPDGTVTQCIAHYLGEMKARGTIWNQIEKVNNVTAAEDTQSSGQAQAPSKSALHYDTHSSEELQEHLPGLVLVKDVEDVRELAYRNWLFMYHDADVEWDNGRHNHPVSLVKWDPVRPSLIRQGKVIRVEKMLARNQPGKIDDGLENWIYVRTFAKWVEEADEATKRATSLGWRNW